MSPGAGADMPPAQLLHPAGTTPLSGLVGLPASALVLLSAELGFSEGTGPADGASWADAEWTDQAAKRTAPTIHQENRPLCSGIGLALMNCAPTALPGPPLHLPQS